MAAVDLFERTLRNLTGPKRQALTPLITLTREDFLAARSEDARERIVDDFIRRTNEESQHSGR